jgi:hypothetical protein
MSLSHSEARAIWPYLGGTKAGIFRSEFAAASLKQRLQSQSSSAEGRDFTEDNTMSRDLLCVARGGGDRWEALCLDLDLAVQGRSFDEVRALLEEAVNTYVADAGAEAEPARSRLLARRVPLPVRLVWAWRFFKAALYGRVPGRDSAVWLPVACHV